MKILVINAGSSSMKFTLFSMANDTVLAKGQFERLGTDKPNMIYKRADGFKFEGVIPVKDHVEAVREICAKLVDPQHGVIKSLSEISAIGHRVLLGGEKITRPVKVDDGVKEIIREYIPLGPLHNPANLAGIEACEAAMPGVPNVAVFDTQFHQTMPPEAYLYAIPYEFYQKYGIRKYGYHGTSHHYVTLATARFLGKKPEDVTLITCHLGNGSSICAINGGKSFDTSMGFTPLDGLPMGTRAGNIDPAIIEFLAEHENMDAHEVINILNKKSGMLGISGVSSDFRDLDAAVAYGNARAALAKDMFNLSVKKIIGSYVAEMGGVDAIIFTAGVGENDRSVRWDVCEHLEYLGIKIDPEKNKYRGKQMDISIDWARVRVLVIPTNEELMIAKDTERLVSAAQ